MIKFEVKDRTFGEVKFTAEIDCAEDAPPSVKLGLAVKWAIKAGANLLRANLAGADLAEANLAGADLAEANLSRADLSEANLSRADLSGANLSRADLSGANLAGANLARAYLSGADLAGAYLSRAYLSRADLSGANLSRAYLSRANLAGANLIDGGQRSDGYRFVGWIKAGVLQIRAGCRDLAIDAARKHWTETRGGSPLGDETMAILDHIEAVACIRGLVKADDRVAA